MIAFSLVVSVGLLLTVLVVCRHRSLTEVAGLLGIAGFCSGCLFLHLPPVIVQVAVGLVTLPLLVVPDRGVRMYRTATVSAFAVGWGLAGFQAVTTEQDYTRLRLLHPFESLTERMPPRPPGIPPAFDAGTLDVAETWYNKQEDFAENFFSGRTRLLRELHERQTLAFADAAGFGFERMRPQRPNDRTLGDRRPPAAETNPSLDLMVRDTVRDFTDPQRWGYRKGERVAGFLPHALRRPPGPAKDWAVETVELVGLLLAPDPQVYVSASLPRMDEVRHAQTRHPDGFESPALARLRAGDELVHDEPAGRLLGAIRAAKQCLQCHGGDRGELLGAFSYRLRPR